MNKTKNHLTHPRAAIYAVVLLFVAQLALPVLVRQASAATLTHSMVRFDRMTTSTATTGTVCARAPSTATETGVWVTFPTGYTVSATTSNWAVSTATTTGWPSGASAWPSIAAPTGAGDFTISGQRVGFQSGDLTANTLYCFNWTNTAALSTPGSTGNNLLGTIATRNSTPADIDTGTFATSVVANDQITVSASINQSFSFSLSGSTDNLGTLTTGAIAQSPTPRTITINTNAKNGWMAWARDSNTGLNSSSASYTIASTGVGAASQQLTAGTEGYNLNVAYSETGGTCAEATAVDENFDDEAGGTVDGGGLDSTLRTIVACSGTTNGGTITLTNQAAINGSTPAASDYTDVQTYVAAGIF